MAITPEILKRMASQMPTAQPKIECDGCPSEMLVSAAVIRGQKMFCSEQCADVSSAVLLHPQPKRTVCEGWDI